MVNLLVLTMVNGEPYETRRTNYTYHPTLQDTLFLLLTLSEHPSYIYKWSTAHTWVDVRPDSAVVPRRRYQGDDIPERWRVRVQVRHVAETPVLTVKVPDADAALTLATPQLTGTVHTKWHSYVNSQFAITGTVTTKWHSTLLVCLLSLEL